MADATPPEGRGDATTVDVLRQRDDQGYGEIEVTTRLPEPADGLVGAAGSNAGRWEGRR